jgi:hypothetical protein
MEVSGQLHARPLFPQVKSPRYPLDRRLGGPQSRFGRGDEEKNSQPPPYYFYIIYLLEGMQFYLINMDKQEM